MRTSVRVSNNDEAAIVLQCAKELGVRACSFDVAIDSSGPSFAAFLLHAENVTVAMGDSTGQTAAGLAAFAQAPLLCCGRR